MESTLGLFASSEDPLPANGPSAILHSRLTRLGWGVGGQGLVQDRFGTFSLMTVSWDELQLRFTYAWGHVLSQELGHRDTIGWTFLNCTRHLRRLGPLIRCTFDVTWMARSSPKMGEPNSVPELPQNARGVLPKMDFIIGPGFARTLLPVVSTSHLSSVLFCPRFLLVWLIMVGRLWFLSGMSLSVGCFRIMDFVGCHQWSPQLAARLSG